MRAALPAVLGGLFGLLAAYLVGLLLLWLAARRLSARPTLREQARLLPDMVGLLKRLALDRGLPLQVRLRLFLALAYLASPVDLIPDVVPVLGYADDAIIVAVVLRSVARVAGPDVLARHWRGTPLGLGVVRLLAGVSEGPAGTDRAGRV